MVKGLFLVLATLACVLAGVALLPDGAMAQPAGTICPASEDDNVVDNGVVFFGRAQEIMNLNDNNCRLSVAIQTDYGDGLNPQPDGLVVINNVNNNDLGFSAGISLVEGSNVTNLHLNGTPYDGGTQITVNTADAFSGTFQFDFDGDSFEIAVVKSAGSSVLQGFTIAAPAAAATATPADAWSVQTRTQRVIGNFLARRADQLTANEPDLSGRLTDDVADEKGLPATVNANGRDGSVELAVSTSLRQILAAAQARQDGHVAEIADRPGLDDRWRARPGGHTDSAYDRLAAWFRPAPNTAAPLGGPAAALPAPGVDLWIDGTWSRSESGNATSDLGLLHIGADYRFSDDLLIGLLGQLDWSRLEDGALNTEIDGFGWMIGPYAAARVHEHLIFDARAAWGRSDNQVSPFGTYTDRFETERWLIRGGLTGDLRLDGWHLTPGVSATYFQERQSGYTDSLGNEIPGQTVSLGRLMFGPEAAYPYRIGEDWLVRPQVGVQGIWTFADAEVVDVATGVAAGGDDLRARAEGGLAVTYGDRYTLSGEGFYDGIGAADFDAFGGSLAIDVRIVDGFSLGGAGFMTGSDATTDTDADYGANLRLKLQLN